MPSLDFKGKQHIYAHHLTVPYRSLIPDQARSRNPADADDNLIIHGDNLHALKALLPRYGGKVKCIYIEPALQHWKRRLDLQRQNQQLAAQGMVQAEQPRGWRGPRAARQVAVHDVATVAVALGIARGRRRHFRHH